MAREIVCRHCGHSFAPTPGKPGYVDECLECLYEKTQRLLPKPDHLADLLDLARKIDSVRELGRKAAVLQRAMLKLGASDEETNTIVKAFRDAGMARFANE